jgi:hypothetical protein
MANRRFIDFPIASTVGDNDIVLIWQDGLNKQTTKGTLIQGAPTSLEGLTDVDIAGLINGQILQYNSVTGKWENVDRTDINLSQLGDVSIVSPSNGQVLVYNSTTSKWENSSAGFVPYVGAVTTVDLGAQGLRAGYVRFNTSVVSVPNEQGLMYWDGDDETIAVILNGYIMKIGEDQFYPVKNQTGSSIAKGTAVRFAGTLGASGRLLIAPFIADGSVSSSFFMGVTAEAIANGADGKVLYFGRIRGINTNAFNEGDVLYASTTVAGGFQTAVPVAPNNIVQVAAVINKSINQGVIFIRPSFGSNINQDEGVKIVSPTTGQLLQLQANGLWENKTTAQVLGGTSSQFVKGDGTLDSNTYQVTSEKGQPNGYASLDSNGKVPLVQINDALIGNVNFQGLWNASTNTPTLANPPASGTKGHYYIVSTAGTFASISFEVGDWIISDGTAWGKVDNTDAVSSVFGRTGNVTAANGDYTTAQVTESGNLYYTDGRARAAISLTTTGASGSSTYNNSTGVLNVPTYTLSGLGGIGGTIAAGQVAFGTAANTIGGDNGLFWDNTNKRLGVGTNAPQANLDIISGTGYSNIAIKTVGNFNVRGDGRVDVGGVGGTNTFLSIVKPLSSSIANLLILQDLNNSRGIIVSCNSNGTSFSQLGNSGFIYFGNALVNSQQLNIDTANQRVGILTASPTQTLDVNGTGRIRNGVSLADVSGNVQIGTTTDAGFLLDVNGTARVQGAATFLSTVTSTSFIRSGGTSSQFLKADGSVDSNTYVTGGPFLPLTGGTLTGALNGTSATFTSSVTAAGGSLFNANSGTLTQDILTVRGGGASGNFGFRVEANNGEDIFFVNNTSYNIIMSPIAGNVLIGTTDNAGFKLDVNGTGRFSGNLSAVFNSNSNTPYIRFDESSSAKFFIGQRSIISGEGGTGYDLYTTSGNDLRFYTGGSSTSRLTLSTTGSATFSSSVTASSGSLFNANSGTLTQDILTVRGGGSSGAFGFRVEANNGDDLLFVNAVSYNVIMGATGGNVLIGTETDNGSRLRVNGSIALPHTTKSANYTLDGTDYTVGFDCASNRTANLPDATTCAGRIYVIYQYNTNIGLRYVTIDGNGSQTINGLTTVNLQYQDDFSSVMIQSNGSNWVVISSALYAAPV